MSCSRTQRSDAGEARTLGHSVSSQALYSIFNIGEFLHVNKKTFTFKLTFLFSWPVEHKISRPGFSEFQKSIGKFVPNFIRRCVRDDP